MKMKKQIFRVKNEFSTKNCFIKIIKKENIIYRKIFEILLKCR
jgi:hypothetical protein